MLLRWKGLAAFRKREKGGKGNTMTYMLVRHKVGDY
jgi:hypothetical protein